MYHLTVFTNRACAVAYTYLACLEIFLDLKNDAKLEQHVTQLRSYIGQLFPRPLTDDQHDSILKHVREGTETQLQSLLPMGVSKVVLELSEGNELDLPHIVAYNLLELTIQDVVASFDMVSRAWDRALDQSDQLKESHQHYTTLIQQIQSIIHVYETHIRQITNTVNQSAAMSPNVMTQLMVLNQFLASVIVTQTFHSSCQVCQTNQIDLAKSTKSTKST